jgi:hypothetical protein
MGQGPPGQKLPRKTRKKRKSRTRRSLRNCLLVPAPWATAVSVGRFFSISLISGVEWPQKAELTHHRDLALENDYLRQENRILRTKFGQRVPLTEADRRILVKYGLRIKDRLREIVAIAKPETLLAWNRRQKKEKWTCQKRRESCSPTGPFWLP